MLHRADENDSLVSTPKYERKIKYTRLRMHTVHTTHTARNIRHLRHRRCTWMEEVRDWSGNANTIIMLTHCINVVFLFKNLLHTSLMSTLPLLWIYTFNARFRLFASLSPPLIRLPAHTRACVRACVLRGGILIARQLSGNQIKVLPQDIFADNVNLVYL